MNVHSIFITVPKGKRPKSPATSERINNWWHNHTMEHNSPMKKEQTTNASSNMSASKKHFGCIHL